jgi:drug/metabolite transporter (DMT)-like permease
MKTIHIKSISMALIAHASFGLYVILAKLLFQSFPPFALLALTFAIALVASFLLLRQNIQWQTILSRSVLLVVLFAAFRSVTKMLAVQYTLASYVQLVDLSSPFFNAIIAWLVLQEKLPKGTIPALMAMTTGAMLVITVNPLHAQLPNGTQDLIGIGFATTSAIFMAILVVVTSYSTRFQSNPTSVYIAQTSGLVITYLLLSILSGETYTSFLSISPNNIIALLCFMLAVVIGGGLTVLAISRVNTTLFSSLLSLRLVVALIAGWFLLGEQLTSSFQLIGAGIVALSITWYLWQQGNSQGSQNI